MSAFFAFEPQGSVFKIDGGQYVCKNVNRALIINVFESDFRRYNRAGIVDDICPFFPVVENEVGAGKCAVTNISEAKAGQYASQIIELLPNCLSDVLHRCRLPPDFHNLSETLIYT